MDCFLFRYLVVAQRAVIVELIATKEKTLLVQMECPRCLQLFASRAEHVYGGDKAHDRREE